jgi:hypothetical protein
MPLSRSRAADRRWIAVVAGGLCGVAAIVGFGLSASADDGGSLSLKPGDSVVVEQTRPMGSSGIAVADHTPEACRDDPTAAQSCDVYRVHFEIDTNPDAFNFARFQADFDTPTTPGLPLVATGLVEINAGDIDLYLYDVTGPEPVAVDLPGATAAYMVPQIAAFEPKVKDYDLVVVSTRAPLLGYTLKVDFSNELFDAPFEALDPATLDRSGDRPVDVSAPRESSSSGSVDASVTFIDAPPVASDLPAVAAAPALQPVGTDTDFAGFRGAVDDSLAGAPLVQRAASAAVVRAKAPAAPMVVFWLLVAPLVLLGAFAVWMRRRRPSALDG